MKRRKNLLMRPSLTLTLKRNTFLCPRNELKWRFEQAKDVGRGTRSAPGIPRVVGPGKATFGTFHVDPYRFGAIWREHVQIDHVWAICT